MEQAKTNITEITEVKHEQFHKEYAGDLSPSCPYCKSDNVYGVSRVVGYFSIIENWNKSKKAELKRRQKGNYWTDDE
ncbi:MAG: anaerobic ribonucleoside-triphosphate reductase [Candidatus Thorarchaeota archaeon]